MKKHTTLPRDLLVGGLVGALGSSVALHTCNDQSRDPETSQSPEISTTSTPTQNVIETPILLRTPPEEYCREISNQLLGHLNLIDTIAIQNNILKGMDGFEVGLLQPEHGSLADILLPSEYILDKCQVTSVGPYLRELTASIADVINQYFVVDPPATPKFTPPTPPTQL